MPAGRAQAPGAMVAEPVGPRGRTVLLRSKVDRHAFRTADRARRSIVSRSSTPRIRTAGWRAASSVLELSRASAAAGLHEHAGLMPASVGESAVLEEVEHPGSAGVRVVVEAPLAIRHPTIAPPHCGIEDVPASPREAARGLRLGRGATGGG